MLDLNIQEYNQTLLGQMETTLAHLAMHWRGADEDEDAKEIARRYQSILLCMIDLGLDHPLDIDSELPDELMPQEYFSLFK
jgi:hypothetical protein